MPQHGLKIDALRPLIEWLEGVSGPAAFRATIQSEGLFGVVIQFAGTLQQFGGLVGLPFDIHEQAEKNLNQRWQWWLGESRTAQREWEELERERQTGQPLEILTRDRQTLKKYRDLMESIEHIDSDAADEQREAALREFLETIASQNKPINLPEWYVKNPIEDDHLIEFQRSPYIFRGPGKSRESMQPAMGAWLGSLVITGWTAFETLAGDLWIAAVNAQPTHLANLSGNTNRIRNLARSRSRAKQAETNGKEPVYNNDYDESPSDKKVTVGLMSRVTRGKFDLSNMMGTLLAKTGRVSFTSLEAIREAYSLAFSEKVCAAKPLAIDAALANSGLDALSAVRNLIVHKAGIGDAEYGEQAARSPAAPRLREGEQIQLDGELCHILLEPVIKACVDLVKAVDEWLVRTKR